MPRFVAFLPALLLAALGIVEPVQAQTEADGRALFEQGNEHFARALAARAPRVRDREFQEALRLYHQALQVARTRSVIYNVALCYQELGRLEDAFSYYMEYLEFEDLTQQDRAEASQRLDALRPRVALIEVASTPSGATVYVDRTDLAPRGVTPVTIAVRAGEHRVVLQAEGHEPASQDGVQAQVGQVTRVDLDLVARPTRVRVETESPGAEVRFDSESATVAGLTPLEASVAAGTHTVFVRLGDRLGREVFDAPPGGEVTVPVALSAPTTPGSIDVAVDVPGAIVTIDGRDAGLAPVRRHRVPPGRHRISVAADTAHTTWTDVIEVGPGHRVRLDVHLAPTVPQRRFGPWPSVGLAVAASLAVAGAATGGWALALHSDFTSIEDQCSGSGAWACAEGSALREEARDLDRRIGPAAITTDVLLSTAAALGVASLVLVLLNRPVADEASAVIALSPLPERGLASATLGRGLLSSP